jgi:hypothetical protein
VDVNQAMTQAGVPLDAMKWMLPIGSGPNYVVVLYNVILHNQNNPGFPYFNYSGNLAVLRLLPKQVAIDTLDGVYYSTIDGTIVLGAIPYHVRAHCGSNYFAVISALSDYGTLVENHFRWQNRQWTHILPEYVTGSGPGSGIPQPSVSVGNNFVTGRYPQVGMRVLQQTPAGASVVATFSSLQPGPQLPFERGYSVLAWADDVRANTSIN